MISLAYVGMAVAFGALAGLAGLLLGVGWWALPCAMGATSLAYPLIALRFNPAETR